MGERTPAAEPIPLCTPGGVVMAWACGHCRRVSGGVSRVVDVYDDDDVATMAEHSRQNAAGCCACRECAGLLPRSAMTATGRYGVCGACWTPAREADATAARDAVAAAVARGRASVERAVDVDAANELRAAMSDLSEYHWCAGWLIGTEHFLWEATAPLREGRRPKPVAWGMGDVQPEDLIRVHTLAIRAGGWWYINAEHVEVFAPFAEWEAMAPPLPRPKEEEDAT